MAAEAVSEVRRKEEESEDLIKKAMEEMDRVIGEARARAQTAIDDAHATVKKIESDKEMEKKRAADEVRKTVRDETEKDSSELNRQRKKNEKSALEKATEHLAGAIRAWP